MKLRNDTPNYCCTVVKLENVFQLENSNNLLGANFFGYNVVVGKDIKLGEKYLFFSAEVKLDEKFMYNNNLYTSPEMNKDKVKKGYIEKSGRIRAIELRGNKSNGLLMPMSSLSYLGINYDKFEIGDTFTHINDVEVCGKYFVPIVITKSGNKQKGMTKKYERIDGKQFPEHFETDQYFRNTSKYLDSDFIYVTQKLHGISCRIGNVECLIKPTIIDRILFRQRKEYDYIAGSCRVIKDLKSSVEFQHFYKTDNLDIYNRVLNKYKHCIPKDTIIYGEVIGYIDWTPIQSNYAYDCKVGEWEFYIYRITTMNKDGFTVDYPWEGVKQFCRNTGMKHCPEIISGLHSEVNINLYMDLKYAQDIKITCGVLPLSNIGTVDEGVCIRKEGINPYITKAKSPLFYEYETKQLDEGIVDLETNQN